MTVFVLRPSTRILPERRRFEGLQRLKALKEAIAGEMFAAEFAVKARNEERQAR